MKLRIKSVIWNIRKQKQSKQQEEKRDQEKEGSVKSLWDNFKCTNICIMGMSEGEENKKLETYLKK